MDKNPKIKDEEISFIVQGALCDKTSEYIACIRKNFLGSEIILSTWQGTVVSEEVAKYCDKILLSKDPGGVPFSFPFGAVVYNNINRQIISTMAGLRAASRHYCVKIRTDFTLKSSDVVKFFNIYPRREQDALVYERRVIVPSIYSRVHLNGVPTPFHSSDFFAFGLKEDLILHFGSCPLQTQEELGEWQYKFPNRCPDPNCQWRFPPEQAFFYHAAKSKFPDIRMYDLTDLKADNIALSHKLMMNNFIFVNSDQIGLYSEKHNKALTEPFVQPGIISNLYFEMWYAKTFAETCRGRTISQLKVLERLETHRWRLHQNLKDKANLLSIMSECLSILYYKIKSKKNIALSSM